MKVHFATTTKTLQVIMKSKMLQLEEDFTSPQNCLNLRTELQRIIGESLHISPHFGRALRPGTGNGGRGYFHTVEGSSKVENVAIMQL